MPRYTSKRFAALLAVLLCFTASTSCQNWPADQDARIQRIEAKTASLQVGANEVPLQLSLEKLMELYKVPGLSVAVIDDYKIVWAKA